MFLVIVLVISAGIIAASVWAGLNQEKQRQARNSPQGARNRQRVNMAKAAGVMPNRKEN